MAGRDACCAFRLVGGGVVEKRHEFAACLFEAVAWFLMNLL
jgi:hypothetical protein